MKALLRRLGRHALGGLAIGVAISAVATLPTKSQPRPDGSIRIQNNSSREIHHIYLAPPGTDNWGEDQLNGATISAGGSFTINNVSCVGGQIDVIAEDTDGCFATMTVTCGSDAAWTITNSTSRNCGN